jgi:hypothetical protein
MAKRLKVILQDPDYREIRRIARARGVSIAQWVRTALAAARREEPSDGVAKKLAALRAAARHNFPAPDIETMLAEIARGYGDGPLP